MTPNYNVDYSKAVAKKDWQFTPFLPKNPVPLKKAGLRPDEDLLILDKGVRRYAFLLRHMTYHHIAQGKLAGQPYMVSF
jgi:hypothetical protein